MERNRKGIRVKRRWQGRRNQGVNEEGARRRGAGDLEATWR